MARNISWKRKRRDQTYRVKHEPCEHHFFGITEEIDDVIDNGVDYVPVKNWYCCDECLICGQQIPLDFLIHMIEHGQTMWVTMLKDLVPRETRPPRPYLSFSKVEPDPEIQKRAA